LRTGEHWGVGDMYEAFDAFIGVDTWHTGHAFDEERFYMCLYNVIWEPGFDPDGMALYLRDFKNISNDDYESAFAKDVERLRSQAWVVYDFIKHNSVKKP
jgi:hypothetical protein